MVAPDHAAFDIDAFGIGRVGAGAGDAAGGGAALAAVEPAIGSPCEAIGDAVGVFEAEAAESDFRWAIELVIAVGVGPEDEVGSLHDPEAAGSAEGGVGHIEAVEDRAVEVERSVAVGIFVDRDAVGSFVVVWWGRWDAVVFRAVVLVAADHADACWVGVLAVLGDPEASPFVVAEVGGLGDEGFVEEGFDSEVGMGFEEGEGLIRGHEGAAFEHRAGLHDRGGRAEFGWGVVFSAAGGICRCELGRLRGRCAAGPSLEGQFVEVSCEDRGMFLEPCRVWQSGAGGGRDTDRETVGEALLEGIARDLAAERAVWRHLKPVVDGFAIDEDRGLAHARRESERHGIAPERVAGRVGHVVRDNDPCFQPCGGGGAGRWSTGGWRRG